MNKTAILYLRVSSQSQLTDYGDDGLSIDGQRERCAAKANDLGAEMVGEYIERAESAKTNARPALQKMLSRLREQRDADYVIVWKVDRWARNRRDDANMLWEIQVAGASLVSATENIDQTPAGQLMHGMLASFSEYYSRNLAAEVVKGATQKAKRGGTPGPVPLGYVNIIERIDGRDIRTVTLDEERAPLIQWAFQTYATGHYSLSDIVNLLEARGLRSRGSRRYTPRSLNHASVHRLLTNSYYVGVVTYRGTHYPGRHPRLVTQTVFDQVQQVLKAHNRSGERDRKQSHYLKGSLFCGECGCRLTYSRNTGNGGTYDYFVCSEKQHRRCSQGYKRADRTEAMLESYYKHVVMSPDRRKRLAQLIKGEAERMAATSETERSRCNNVLADLKEQERKLLRAHYEDRLSDELYDEEAARISREREQIESIAARLDVEFDDAQENAEVAMSLLSDIQRAYGASPPHVRRLINQAIFTRIELSDIDEINGQVAEPFASLVDDRLFETRWAESWGEGRQMTPERPEVTSRNDEGPDPVGSRPHVTKSDLGSISFKLVGETGFEPATARPPAGCATRLRHSPWLAPSLREMAITPGAVRPCA
jgi:site-specific DNA recombinase